MSEEVRKIFDDAQSARAFPGGVVWLAHNGKVLLHDAFGTTAYDDEISQPVSTETIYDIASVSKLFTMTAFLIAARAANADVNTPLRKYFGCFDTSDKRAITLRHLLNHTSGIEVAIQSFTPAPSQKPNVTDVHHGEVPVERWIETIAQKPLRTAPGEKVLYSCTNYFLLARVVEQLCGERLDAFLAREILSPLQMTKSTFRPLDMFSLPQIAPTEIDDETGQAFRGVVHDEAARTWQSQTNSACGNAGLFSTAADLAEFAQLWLDEGTSENRQILHPDDVRAALLDLVPEDDGSLRGWCWHIDSVTFMSEKAPPGTAGHGGFTGTSLYFHPATRHAAVVLTNRVYPTRNGPNRFPFQRRIARWLWQHNGTEAAP